MCSNFLKRHPCREGGQKEANVEKYGKPIESVFVSPVALDSPILQHKSSAEQMMNEGKNGISADPSARKAPWFLRPG